MSFFSIFENDFNYLNPAKVILIEDWRPIAYKSIDSDAKTDDAKRMALKPLDFAILMFLEENRIQMGHMRR